ncbi:MAG: hypothetical protein IJ538_03180 [Clostridia bacterium]|nr:hypothetical protein [Clostridia bacterium]
MASKNYRAEVVLYNGYFDCNDKLKPSAIFMLFQDIASIHGEEMGVGFEAMVKSGYYWVVTRVKYDVLIQPQVYEKVIIETWPHAPGRVDFDRDFLITNTSGEVLIKGTSKWCIISTETRKLVPISNINYLTEFDSKINYEERFLRTPSVENFGTPVFTHKVTYNEIDHNKHLNNTHYADYVFNAVCGKLSSHVEISFIAECKLGDEIEVFKMKNESGETLISGYVNGEIKFSAMVK